MQQRLQRLTPTRKKRLAAVALIVTGVSASIALMLNAFQSNLLYFVTPAEVIAGAVAPGEDFRIGGLVAEGSIVRPDEQTLAIDFVITDTVNAIPVRYVGILPDLFREGQGVVAKGSLDGKGVFQAQEVLAKHDENYMPPEVAEALEAAKTLQVEKGGVP